MPRWIIITVVAVVVIAGLVVGLFFALRGKETILIGIANPDTGMAAPQGLMSRHGFEIAVDHINADGGVYVADKGKKLPLELIILDDESDPGKTSSRLESLYARGVVVTAGGPMSFLQAAAAGTADANKVPHVGFFGTMAPHREGYEYLFCPFLKIGRDTELSVGEWILSLPEAERPTKLAIWHILTDGGDDSANWWKAHAAEYGLTIVYEEEYTLGTTEFSTMITNTMAAVPEADRDELIVHGFPITPEAIAMITEANELGFKPKMFWFIRGPDTPAFGESLGDLANGVFFTSGWTGDAPFPGVDRLNATHQELYGRKADPITGNAYAAIQVIADAIERAGTLDREAIRDALAATDMMTVNGPIKFNPDGTPVDVFTPGLQWQAGEQVLIWPKEHGGYDVPEQPHYWP